MRARVCGVFAGVGRGVGGSRSSGECLNGGWCEREIPRRSIKPWTAVPTPPSFRWHPDAKLALARLRASSQCSVTVTTRHDDMQRRRGNRREKRHTSNCCIRVLLERRHPFYLHHRPAAKKNCSQNRRQMFPG